MKNASINYNNLKYFQNKISNKREENIKDYIILLDPSLKSIHDILIKSRYADFQQLSIKDEFQRIKNLKVKISIRKELRTGLPLGIYTQKNKLNELTGKEWIKFTKSWFVHNPPPRNTLEILHPAKFPESLIEEFIILYRKSYNYNIAGINSKIIDMLRDSLSKDQINEIVKTFSLERQLYESSQARKIMSSWAFIFQLEFTEESEAILEKHGLAIPDMMRI